MKNQSKSRGRKDDQKNNEEIQISSLEELKSLNDTLNRASEIIKNAVKNQSKIVIKHHNDADGLCGGYMLAASIINFAKEENIKANISRITYSHPDYSYGEALKDISFMKDGDVLVLVDTGSSSKSIEAFKRLNHHNIHVIVVDHHPYEQSEKLDNVIIINPNKRPHITKICASLICGALCEYIKPVHYRYMLSAIGCFADKYHEEEYFKKILDVGKSLQSNIEMYAKFIDYELFYSKGNDYGIIPFIFNKNNQEYIEYIYGKIKEIEKNLIDRYEAHTHNQGNIFVIDYENLILPGHYPPPGKATGILFEHLKKKHDSVCVLGIINNLIVVRSNDPKLTLSHIHNIIESKINAKLESGGHEEAGSIKIPGKRDINLRAEDIARWLYEHRKSRD